MINPAFYKNIIPLNSDSLRKLRIDKSKVNFGFARSCTSLTITCSEFSRIAPEYPIGFIRGEDQQLHPMALLGFPGTDNLYVSPSNQWDANYIPFLAQHYPYFLPEFAQSDLYIDDQYAALNFESGELLSDAAGILQQVAKDELKLLQSFHRDMTQTEQMVKQLEELGLFVQQGIRCDTAGNETLHLNDFYTIDETRFKLIPEAILPNLFQSGALALVYLHIASLNNIPALLKRSVFRAAQKKLKLSAIIHPASQNTNTHRTPEQLAQKPMLRSKVNEDMPPIVLAGIEQEDQRKQEIVKRLTEEKNRLAQVHKERYAPEPVPIQGEETPVEILPVTEQGKIRRLPVWAWGVLLFSAAGFAMLLSLSEKNRDSAPPARANTATPPPPNMPSSIQTDPLSDAMVKIPSGSFEMGSSDGDADEKPLRQVKISHSFEIGKTEVTQAQWKAVMGSLPDKLNFKNCGENCPVENISWNDAQDFINKLNALSGKSYRLPSEAEWEYACRAGGTQRYCGSDNLDSIAWYGNEKIGKTPHSVAGKQANAWGLYDMSGNVWEWVSDCYHDRYSGAPDDGSSWTKDSCDARVLRGGSWSNEADTPRSANRYKRTAKERLNNNGFRLARSIP